VRWPPFQKPTVERIIMSLSEMTSGFAAYLDQKLKELGGEGAPAFQPSTNAGSSADDIAVCPALDMSQADFPDAKRSEKGR
tara:strand:+ start:515 stop:757 length:243 start_codon:yes stop_codon:yes gene_type:complete